MGWIPLPWKQGMAEGGVGAELDRVREEVGSVGRLGVMGASSPKALVMAGMHEIEHGLGHAEL